MEDLITSTCGLSMPDILVIGGGRPHADIVFVDARPQSLLMQDVPALHLITNFASVNAKPYYYHNNCRS